MNDLYTISITGQCDMLNDILNNVVSLDAFKLYFIKNDITCFMHAAGYGQLEIIKLYLSFFDKITTNNNEINNIFDINYHNKYYTALTIAINQRQIKCVELLLNHSALLIFDDIPEYTYNEYHNSRTLLNITKISNAFNDIDSELIYYHILSISLINSAYLDCNIVKLLLNYDRRLFKLQDIGEYFVRACRDNDIELVTLYLNNAFDINYISVEKSTTGIIEAIKNNNMDIIELLFNYNRNMDLVYRDKYGKNAYDYISENKNVMSYITKVL